MSLLHCHTAPLPYWTDALLDHHTILHCSHFLTDHLPYCNNVQQCHYLQYYIALLSHCQIATLPHCIIFPLLNNSLQHSFTTPMSHCPTVSLPLSYCPTASLPVSPAFDVPYITTALCHYFTTTPPLCQTEPMPCLMTTQFCTAPTSLLTTCHIATMSSSVTIYSTTLLYCPTTKLQHCPTVSFSPYSIITATQLHDSNVSLPYCLASSVLLPYCLSAPCLTGLLSHCPTVSTPYYCIPCAHFSPPYCITPIVSLLPGSLSHFLTILLCHCPTASLPNCLTAHSLDI